MTKRTTRLGVAAGLSLLVGGAAQALTVSVLQNKGRPGGGVVVIEIDNDTDSQSQPGGYSLCWNYDVFTTSSVETVYAGDPDASIDPNASFGQMESCSEGAQNCIGANGGTFGTA